MATQPLQDRETQGPQGREMEDLPVRLVRYVGQNLEPSYNQGKEWAGVGQAPRQFGRFGPWPLGSTWATD